MCHKDGGGVMRESRSWRCVGVEFGHTVKSGELERATASVIVSTVGELADAPLGG